MTDRWLGGTVSNWSEIKKNIKDLTILKAARSPANCRILKKDLSLLRKESGRLNKMVGVNGFGKII